MRRFVAGLALACLLMACGQADHDRRRTGSSTEQHAYGGMADMDARRRQRAKSAPDAAPAPPPRRRPAMPRPWTTTRGPRQPQPAQASRTGPSPILFLAYTYCAGPRDPERAPRRRDGSPRPSLPSRRPARLPTDRLQPHRRSRKLHGRLRLAARRTDVAAHLHGRHLEAQADEAGGRIIAENVTNAEDLTRQIVDTEARLRAQTALRDRLQELLRSRPGRLADLLEVERELARVQGELDATQSNLAVMRTRVAMSELTLSYRSAPRPVGSDTFEPLRNAFANFLGIIVGGFAAIITIIAGLIPFAVVVVPLVWLALRWRQTPRRALLQSHAKADGAATAGDLTRPLRQAQADASQFASP